MIFIRNLATIRAIGDIDPIPGKDRIVLAHVDGWQVIVKKDEFQRGDKCVYIEIDSVLPERPEFEFLRSKGFRIKTMKMGGVLSQGICFPMSILNRPEDMYKLGDDVTTELGIVQYQETMDDPVADQQDGAQDKQTKWPRFLMRFSWFGRIMLRNKSRASGAFPSFISKTDETRIQNCPWVLTDTSRRWVASEKVDGSSATYALVKHKSKIPFVRDKYEFFVCSRNRRLVHRDDSPYWHCAMKYRIESVLHDIIGRHDWVAIQGEIIGPKIQKNRYNRKGYELYVFNLVYPDGRRPSTESKIVVGNHGLLHVPLLATNLELPTNVNDVLTIAHGMSVLSDTMREGIVFRGQDGKMSFKAVDPEYLLKYDA